MKNCLSGLIKLSELFMLNAMKDFAKFSMNEIASLGTRKEIV